MIKYITQCIDFSLFSPLSNAIYIISVAEFQKKESAFTWLEEGTVLYDEGTGSNLGSKGLDYLQQQQRQSAMQEQMPQQIQQMQERTREATTTAMISQSHHTGRHSPARGSFMIHCQHCFHLTYPGVTGSNVVHTLAITAALTTPELGECILSFIPGPLGLVPDRAIIVRLEQVSGAS